MVLVFEMHLLPVIVLNSTEVENYLDFVPHPNKFQNLLAWQDFLLVLAWDNGYMVIDISSDPQLAFSSQVWDLLLSINNVATPHKLVHFENLVITSSHKQFVI